MGDFPLMTKEGTFIINGAERVVVSQLVRSPGVYFTADEDPSTGRPLFAAKLIPNRGAWLEFETSNKDLLSVKIDRKRKIPVTTLLRAMAAIGDRDPGKTEFTPDLRHRRGHPRRLRGRGHRHPISHFIQATLDKDTVEDAGGGAARALSQAAPRRPADARQRAHAGQQPVLHPRRYDLGSVGRYKLNRKLDLSIPQTIRTLTQDDAGRHHSRA